MKFGINCMKVRIRISCSLLKTFEEKPHSLPSPLDGVSVKDGCSKPYSDIHVSERVTEILILFVATFML